MKRYFDVFLSLIGIILSSPIWLIAGIAIKIDDGGPVFYCQDRVGKNNKIFSLRKFRTMIKNAEQNTGPVWAKENDSRITRVGKILRVTAMDELPQLLSIFKGDMSFVGPRPERPELVEQFVRECPDFNLRHKIIPGLTGVAQVLGSPYLEYSKKLKYDIWYQQNQNFCLDIYLILLSFLITFMGKWELKESKFKRLTSAFKSRVEEDISKE